MFVTEELLHQIAKRVRGERRRQKLSQRAMADKSGVSFRAYQQFESSGNTSLKRFANILNALGLEGELASLLSKPEFESLDAFEKGTA